MRSLGDEVPHPGTFLVKAFPQPGGGSVRINVHHTSPDGRKVLSWFTPPKSHEEAERQYRGLLSEGVLPAKSARDMFPDPPAEDEEPGPAPEPERMGRKSRKWVSGKIKKLIGEGKRQRQAVAIALSMAGREGDQ
jgi:hypothetical protein